MWWQTCRSIHFLLPHSRLSMYVCVIVLYGCVCYFIVWLCVCMCVCMCVCVVWSMPVWHSWPCA
jgi:hypothetical protein